MTNPTAAFLAIGSELLSGRTQDKNLQYLARALRSRGIEFKEAQFIPDNPNVIISRVNQLRQQYDYLFTSGGIGPTHDDITSECIAKAFGRQLVKNDTAYKLLENFYKNRGDEFNEGRQKMAYMPQNVDYLIPNNLSIAPGFQVENTFVMAGVPKIFTQMVDDIKDRLFQGNEIFNDSFKTDLGEGQMAQELNKIQKKFTDVEIGSYPFSKEFGYGVELVFTSYDKDRLQQCKKATQDLVEELSK